MAKLENFSRYEINEDGSIWSYISNKFLQQYIDKDGYKRVNLQTDNKQKKECLVHRLVAMAFIPNPNNYTEVNHINEDKQFNHSFNLEWCDKIYNTNYGTRTERASITIKQNKIFALENNPNAKAVIMCDKNTHEEIKRFESIAEACLYIKQNTNYASANSSCIGRVCRGVPKYKSMYGYFWKYA